MAVTKQTYSVSPVWTAAGLANRFRDAFIDAGLMTDWYDSFANGGIENRILEITYDGAATYGKCYYWFMFSTTFVGMSVATGWSTATDAPTGTQYLDFFSTATNTTANHYSITGTAALITGTEASIVRYTSAGDSDYSWFVFRNGAVPYPFMITPANAPRVSWLDLSKTMFHHFVVPRIGVRGATFEQSTAGISFRSIYKLRRSYVGGYALRSVTGAALGYSNEPIPLNSYMSFSNSDTLNVQNQFAPGSSSTFSSNTYDLVSSVLTPAGLNNTNPAYLTDYVPVLFGPSYSPYVNERLPDDFAIYFPFTATQFAYGSRVVIAAGTEEWEVLAFVNNNFSTAVNPLLLARVV